MMINNSIVFESYKKINLECKKKKKEPKPIPEEIRTCSNGLKFSKSIHFCKTPPSFTPDI